MQAMPAFLWNKRRVLVSHRGSLIRKDYWSSVVAAFDTNAESSALPAASASTIDFHPRPFALSADAPCNILRRRARRGNRDSDRLARWRHRPRNDGAFQWGCASGLQNVCDVSKRPADAAPDEQSPV